ncbi:hypothetical protein FACS189492_2400 [Clostridia bacterium]|nr:hypothetical protein FACS189492_2400 [Clostridia bacterium]
MKPVTFTGNTFDYRVGTYDILVSASNADAQGILYKDVYSQAVMNEIAQNNGGCIVHNEYLGSGGGVTPPPPNPGIQTLAEFKAALAAATSGEIVLDGVDINIAETITIDKAVTIRGRGGAAFNTTGTATVFALSGGATLDGIAINKSDKAGQTLVTMASNTTVRDCVFTGDFASGDAALSYGIVTERDSTGVTIRDNEFTSLAQALLTRGAATVTGNDVDHSDGFFIGMKSEVVMTDNSFTGIENAANGNAAITIVQMQGETVCNAAYQGQGLNNISARNGDVLVYNRFTSKGSTGIDTIAALEAAIAGASPNDVITLKAGTYAVTTTINVGSGITVKGESGTKIIVSGVTAFNLSDGASLDGITFETDGADVEIVCAGDNCKVLRCLFTGTYIKDAAEHSIGVRQNAGSVNLTVEGNTFRNLTHPAYLEGTGRFAGNTVNGAGAVEVCVDYVIAVTGNTFANRFGGYDIVIISNGKAPGNSFYASNYADIAAIAAANGYYCTARNDYTNQP